MIGYLTNTLTGYRPGTESSFPPGVTKLIELVTKSRPVLETYVTTRNSEYKELRRKAFLPEATVETSKLLVSEIISQMRTASASAMSKPLQTFYGLHMLSPYWSKYAPDSMDGHPYQANGLSRELSVAIWNYAALKFLAALADYKINLTMMLDTADLFEWHSQLAEKSGFGTLGTIGMISIYANADAGKMMSHICLALFSYGSAIAAHNKYCSDPKISVYSYWFAKNAEIAFKATFIDDWLKVTSTIYKHACHWNQFFFWANHCIENTKNTNSTNENVLRAMTKLLISLEKEKAPCADAFRKTLENTREVSKTSASWSWAFWSSDPGEINQALLPIQNTDSIEKLMRWESTTKNELIPF